MMDAVTRVRRHLRIMNSEHEAPSRPSFLVLFINSICNMKCEHCFYWTSLNKKDDLTVEEIFELSRSMGRIENLNLSGGEPFLRPEFAEICRQFIRHNGVRQIYVPSNGYFTDRTVTQVTATLQEKDLDLLVVELSLDGMPEFHDKFRVAKNAFSKAMQTYEAVIKIQESDPRVRVHCISTATNVNMDEIRRLTTYLYDRCPKMDHHNLAIIRGDRKNPTLTGPVLKQYEELYEYIRRLWAPREEGRYGSIVEPMLQWAKVKTVKEQKQVVPCLAGRITGVVYANGDVGVCEMHKPIGNLREKNFQEIWNSPEANELRRSIAARECYCTTEVFMWPSVVYQPVQLARGMVAGNIFSRPVPLPSSERADYSNDPLPASGGRLATAGATSSQ